MKLLLDMNLSPRWVSHLNAAGHVTRHRSEVGPSTAPDSQIMTTARTSGEAIITNDLDFGTLLALTGDEGPSVVLLRAEVLTPEAIGPHLRDCLTRFEMQLRAGALLVLDEFESKVRLLPIPRR